MSRPNRPPPPASFSLKDKNNEAEGDLPKTSVEKQPKEEQQNGGTNSEQSNVSSASAISLDTASQMPPVSGNFYNSFPAQPIASQEIPSDNNSKEEPTGMGTSLAKKAVPFVAPLPPPDVSLTSSTSAVTCEVCILVSIRPMTTVVVLEGVVYTVYGVPAAFGSAAKVTTLNVFAMFVSPYPNAMANAVGSSVLNPALDRYVLTSVKATCFIVPSSLVTILSASTSVVELADVPPSMMLSSVAVASTAASLVKSACTNPDTPSSKFNSVAVDVMDVPAICSVVAFTSPELPYITALLFTIVPADEPSTKFNSVEVESTAASFVKSACTNPDTPSNKFNSVAVAVSATSSFIFGEVSVLFVSVAVDAVDTKSTSPPVLGSVRVLDALSECGAACNVCA